MVYNEGIDKMTVNQGIYNFVFIFRCKMPKVKEGCKYKKCYSEAGLSSALDAVRKGMSKKEASKLYGIPRGTLQFRLSDKFKKCGHGPPPVLSSEEENLLVSWITENLKKGFPVRKEDIQVSVKLYLDKIKRKTLFVDNLPGDRWYNRFLERHKLAERTSEAVTQSSACLSADDLKKWFVEIRHYLEEKGCDEILKFSNRIFNGDETCFLLGPKETKVLAPKGTKNVYEVDRAVAKSNLTVMFTFSAAGDTIPPMIIYPYKRLPKPIFDSVPKEWGIGLSDNGWMKSEVFFEYISLVLHPYLLKKNIQFPIILFVDGHKTHLTFQLSKLCIKLNIILIALYPNATRILQPADVGVFKPVKNMWKRAVLEWRRLNPDEQLTKEKFAPILKIVVDNIKPSCIINGFRATGLYPFNFDAIDASKCLGKRKTSDANDRLTNDCMIDVEEPINENGNIRCESNNKYLSYDAFCDVVGHETIDQFENFAKDGRDETESLLYKLWCKFKEIPKENPKNQDAANGIIHEDNPEDIQINIVHSLKDGEEEKSESHSFEISKEIIENTDSVPSNEDRCLKELLYWPDTPQRKNKRHSEKMPYVITSTGWKNVYTEKKRKKEEEEKNKEIKRTERLKKRLIKANQIKGTTKNKKLTNKKDKKLLIENNEVNDEEQGETLYFNLEESIYTEKKRKNEEEEKNKEIKITEPLKFNLNVRTRVRPQVRFKINMWCGINNDTVIGTVFLEENLNAERYLNLLNVNVEDLLDSLPLTVLPQMWFQHDGCAAHNARIVRDYLNEKWIGTHGPIAWPPRSPWLNPLDYFL
ncbi:hypothetical protein NQ315_002591 [Exocentrus adspersus]|uniref:HTH CENPB-type domain-containing protein n=1 Tax=Exocentrus adspersus TaxID=1586481 RepID=A0AAV8VUQ4_9CUCU|nr:hypothetical protein NQ315_002591 [Exocentrus adspersus]